MNFYNRKLIEHIENECQKHNIKLRIDRNVNSFKFSGTSIVGYFDHYERELAVAAKNGRFMGILIHEYAHMLQWIENPKSYSSHKYIKFWDWVDLKYSNKDGAKSALFSYCFLERDCGIRGLQIVKDFHIPLSYTRWVQRHNIELAWARMSFDHQSFGDCKWIYYPNNLLKLMPTHFNFFPEHHLPEKIQKNLLKYFV